MAIIDSLMVDIYNIEWEKDEALEEYDWYCDNCDALLNIQHNFDPYCIRWECAECGYLNDICKENIVETRPSSVNGVEMYFVSSIDDLRKKIREYLESEYGGVVLDFDYNADTDGLSETDEYDDDYELADFCRGGDLSED